MASFAGSKRCYLTIQFLLLVKESPYKKEYLSASLCQSSYQVIQNALVLAKEN